MILPVSLLLVLPLVRSMGVQVNVGSRPPTSEDSGVDLNGRFEFSFPSWGLALGTNYEFGQKLGFGSFFGRKEFSDAKFGPITLREGRLNGLIDWPTKKSAVVGVVHVNDANVIGVEVQQKSGLLKGLLRRELIPGRFAVALRPVVDMLNIGKEKEEWRAPIDYSATTQRTISFFPRIDLATGELQCLWLTGFPSVPKLSGGALKLALIGSTEGSQFSIEWQESRLLGGLWSGRLTFPLEDLGACRLDVEREMQLL